MVTRMTCYFNWRFCTQRLPTEAEWEYAARERGKKIRFGTGKNTVGPDEANFDARSKCKKSYSRVGTYRGQTVAVGSFSPNGLGIYDMSGNVYEWCQDKNHDKLLIIECSRLTIAALLPL